MATREDVKKARNKILAGIAGAAVVVGGAAYGANKLLKKDAEKNKIENTVSDEQQKLQEEFYDALIVTDVDRVKDLINQGADINAKFKLLPCQQDVSSITEGDAIEVLVGTSLHTQFYDAAIHFPFRKMTDDEKKARKKEKGGWDYHDVNSAVKRGPGNNYTLLYGINDITSSRSPEKGIDSFTLKYKKNEKIMEIINILADNSFIFKESYPGLTAKRLDSYGKWEADSKYARAMYASRDITIDMRGGDVWTTRYTAEQRIKNGAIVDEEAQKWKDLEEKIKQNYNQKSQENTGNQSKVSTYQVTQRDFDGR